MIVTNLRERLVLPREVDPLAMQPQPPHPPHSASHDPNLSAGATQPPAPWEWMQQNPVSHQLAALDGWTPAPAAFTWMQQQQQQAASHSPNLSTSGWTPTPAVPARVEQQQAGGGTVIVRLHKPEVRSVLGLTLVGTGMTPQVHALAPNCIAADSGQIRVGQLIYAVNGVEVQDHNAATSLLKAAHGVVELTLSSNVMPDIDEW